MIKWMDGRIDDNIHMNVIVQVTFGPLITFYGQVINLQRVCLCQSCQHHHIICWPLTLWSHDLIFLLMFEMAPEKKKLFSLLRCNITNKGFALLHFKFLHVRFHCSSFIISQTCIKRSLFLCPKGDLLIQVWL